MTGPSKTEPTPDSEAVPAEPPRIDRIGESLRRVFDDAATEPLPKAFEDLLRQLR